MALLKKLFPYSFGIKDTADFIVKLIVYVVAGAIAGILIGVLAGIPIVGLIFSIVGGLVDLYVTVGIVLTILVFCKILK
jgi:hypothetical protein